MRSIAAGSTPTSRAGTSAARLATDSGSSGTRQRATRGIVSLVSQGIGSMRTEFPARASEGSAAAAATPQGVAAPAPDAGSGHAQAPARLERVELAREHGDPALETQEVAAAGHREPLDEGDRHALEGARRSPPHLVEPAPRAGLDAAAPLGELPREADALERHAPGEPSARVAQPRRRVLDAAEDVVEQVRARRHLSSTTRAAPGSPRATVPILDAPRHRASAQSARNRRNPDGLERRLPGGDRRSAAARAARLAGGGSEASAQSERLPSDDATQDL